MKIGIIAPPWVPIPPPAYGGTEAVVDRLARGLHATDGIELLLWTTGDSTCPVPRGHVLKQAEPDHMGIAAIELRHLIHGYEAMLEWGADLVHDHTLIGPVYAQRFPDLPVVTTNHGPFNAELAALYRVISPDVPIIAISHDQARSAGEVPIAAVIHHGIDLDVYPFGEGDGDEEGDYLLYLGRMAPEKGARRAALAAKETGDRLIIAAKMREALEREFYTTQILPLLDEKIVYIGEAGEQEKIGLLKGAKALVNPIRWPEPFGLVMIEALACGTPVLSYKEGAAPEIIDHEVTGFLVDDLQDLVAHLPRIDEIDRHACRKAVEERFTTERMVEAHIDLFTRILAERAGSRS
jgi:glycosyltransferase involved in cell wall biosynthesis